MIGLRSSSHSLPFLPSQQEGRRSGWVLFLKPVGGLIDVGAGLLVSSRGISWISPRFGDKHIGLRAKEGSRENASPLSQQFLPGDGAPYCCLLASLFLFFFFFFFFFLSLSSSLLTPRTDASVRDGWEGGVLFLGELGSWSCASSALPSLFLLRVSCPLGAGPPLSSSVLSFSSWAIPRTLTVCEAGKDA